MQRHAMRLLHAGHRAVRQGPARRQPRAHARRRSATPSPATSAAAPATARSSKPSRPLPPACGDNRRWPPHPAPALEVIGKRLPRVDARERVTGQAIYPADLALPGTVHAKLLRSPHAHARIARIDTSRAAALKGVLAIVTAADFPELPVGATIPMGETGYDMWMVAQLNMARHKVHWVGQPVAGVAAVDVHVAEAALALIEVDYEPLAPVLDIAAAMAPDAPVLHEHVVTKGVEPRPRAPSNVCSRTAIARGDATRALDGAAATARVSVQVDTAHQGYLEPQVVVAQVDANGFATVWASTQGQFTAELMIARMLGHAAVAAQDRAARDRRRLRRQDRHPRRGRRRAPGPEVRPPGQARLHARGGAAGRQRPRRRRADRHRGRRRRRRPPGRHRGHLSHGCGRAAGALALAAHAGLRRPLPVPQPRTCRASTSSPTSRARRPIAGPAASRRRSPWSRPWTRCASGSTWTRWSSASAMPPSPAAPCRSARRSPPSASPPSSTGWANTPVGRIRCPRAVFRAAAAWRSATGAARR